VRRVNISVERAGSDDLGVVTEILREAAAWAEACHGELWSAAEIAAARVHADIERGEFFIAHCDGVAAATIRYQLTDDEFWPEAPAGDAAYVHRLAVRREFAGRGIASALLDWAAERARGQGLTRLRLDADLSRPKLRALYERCGFRAHSEARVGPYHVMRYERPLR